MSLLSEIKLHYEELEDYSEIKKAIRRYKYRLKKKLMKMSKQK